MSKAEDKAKQRALEAYPVKEEWVGNQYGSYGDVNERFRGIYQEGYKQAEKDLELTWEDIETILNIENDILHECNSRIQLLIETYPTAKDYYQEILKRFNVGKKDLICI